MTAQIAYPASALAAIVLMPLAPAFRRRLRSADRMSTSAPDYVPVEVGSGWYLRGDIGYAFSDPIRASETSSGSTQLYQRQQPVHRQHRHGLSFQRLCFESNWTVESLPHRHVRRPCTGASFRSTLRRRHVVCGTRLSRSGPADTRLAAPRQCAQQRAQLHGQWLRRSRHLCRLHALCRRRPRLHLRQVLQDRIGYALLRRGPADPVGHRRIASCDDHGGTRAQKIRSALHLRRSMAGLCLSTSPRIFRSTSAIDTSPHRRRANVRL